MASASSLQMRPWRMVGMFVHDGVISVVHHLCTEKGTTVHAAEDFSAAAAAAAAPQAQSAAADAPVSRALKYALSHHDDAAHAVGGALPRLVVLPDMSRLACAKSHAATAAAHPAEDAELYDALMRSGETVFVNRHESCLGHEDYYNYYTPLKSMAEVQAAAAEFVAKSAPDGAKAACTTAGQSAAVFACRRMQEDVEFLWRSCAVQEGDEPPHHPQTYVDNYGYEGDDWVARWSWSIHGARAARWISALNLAVCNAYDAYAPSAAVPSGATAALPPPVLPEGVTLPRDASARTQYTAARDGVVRLLSSEGGGEQDVAAASHALLACARLPTSLKTVKSVGRSRDVVLPGDGDAEAR